MSRWVLALGLVWGLASLCFGEVSVPNAELKGLLKECEGVDKARKGWNRQEQSPEFKEQVRALQKKVVIYTRTHTDRDLDVNTWGWGLLWRLYRDYLLLTLETYPEGEAAIGELWELLDEAEPRDDQVAPGLDLSLVFAFVGEWAPTHPLDCAAIWDEEGARVADHNQSEVSYLWRAYSSTVEGWLVRYAEQVPAEERQEFFDRRYRNLMSAIADESLLPFCRAKTLSCWIVFLNATGRWQEASAVVEAWWKKYGPSMTEPDYYLSRMWVAWYGEGDWEKASDTLRRFSRVAREENAQVSYQRYRQLTDIYYTRIFSSGYELRRQHSEQAQAQKGPSKR